jgi:hypothetical protein
MQFHERKGIVISHSQFTISYKHKKKKKNNCYKKNNVWCLTSKVTPVKMITIQKLKNNNNSMVSLLWDFVLFEL